MRYTRLAVALLALAVLRAAECAAQPSFWITAPGCEQSTGFNVIHGNLLVTGATVACEYDATTLALVRTIPLPAPATVTRVIEAPGDDFLLAGSSPAMHLVDGPTGGVVQTYVDPTPGGNFGWDIGISGTHVLATDPLEHEVHVFDFGDGRAPTHHHVQRGAVRLCDRRAGPRRHRREHDGRRDAAPTL
jgi:hypothetical protein